MNRIFVLMGKSSSGKDSIFRELMKMYDGRIKTIVPYTTRPMRDGEENGDEYVFTDDKEFERLRSTGKIIEERSYNTIQGLWRYFTVNDGSFDDDTDVMIIGTIDTYLSISRFFGDKKTVIPIYIECDDGERLIRAVNREKKRQEPQYKELCRRFLSDDEDFSEENLKKAGIEKSFFNDDLMRCVKEIAESL
ncbi:MAG: guanylate kinase [Lachnospiraceae bacterium]|nr:guanylate kinase [Lachnospiraceae bacterium]MCR5023015.1 guanylate kinase [Lachnospiraceae bacterium]